MGLDQILQFALLLPDDPVGTSVAEQVGELADVRLDHESGKPWFIARTVTDPVIFETLGQKAVALVGPSSADEGGLRRILSQADDADALVRAASRFDGSFVVFGKIAGSFFARGPAMQTRRLFTAVVGDARAVSDRADVLAHLGHKQLEMSRVALQLTLGLPSPANDFPVWAGVESISGEQYALMRSDGAFELRTWWTRPAPVASRSEGAEKLRRALESAVRVRTAGDHLVAADLSGGLDSTPVCYFAARRRNGCVAKTFYADYPGGREDLLWAKKALASIPGLTRHVVSSVEHLPGFFENLEATTFPDEPTSASMTGPRYLQILAEDLEVGASVHLTGIGGDHLFRGLPMWEKDIFRSNPRLAWRRLRSDPFFEGQSSLTLLKDLFDKRSFRQWYTDTIDRAAEDVSGTRLPMPRLSDWSIPIEFTPWLAEDTRATLMRDLTHLATISDPLGARPSDHFDLYFIRDAAKVARGMGQIGSEAGVLLDAPLLDDHVVEAVMGVAYHERDSPLEWKPLMKAAMTGLLPDDYLMRTTKVGGDPQSLRGFNDNYPSLVRLWDEAGLFEHGLLDRDRFFNDVQPSATKAPSRFVLKVTNLAIFLKAHLQQHGRVPV